MKKFLVYFFSFVILPLVMFEMLARSYFYVASIVESGEMRDTVEYVRKAHSKALFFSNKKNKVECKFNDILYPHPYLEYVYHEFNPCGGHIISGDATGAYGKIPINNVSLPSPHDLEPSHNENYFTVMITGGSVASDLGLYGMLKQKGKVPYIENELNRLYESPNGKPFRLINGSFGGWKYPNQFILFSLYADRIDGLITVDGFNEHYVFAKEVPSWFFEADKRLLEIPTSGFGVVHPLASKSISGIASEAIASYLLKSYEDSTFLRNSYGAAFLYRGLVMYFNKQSYDSSQTGRLNEKVKKIFDAKDYAHNHEELYALNIKAYKKYLTMMDSISERLGVANANFIQPVPALHKQLTEEETEVAGNLDYGPLYQRIASDMLELNKEGVPVFSLLEVFKEKNSTMYADSVHCRWDNDCNKIMIAEIFKQIEKEWGLKRKDN